MTRDEALKKMQAVKSYMTSGNPIWSVTEMGEAFDMAIEALEQQTAQQWIPCSERLPEKEDIYLVAFDKDSLLESDVPVSDAYWKDGKWQYAMIEVYENKMPKFVIEPMGGLKIVKWKPLPEPWKGEEP